MITLKALKAKCQKYWDAQHLQRAILTQESLFPLTLSKVRFTARDLASGFADIRDGVQQLRLHSKESKGVGFTVCYETIQHRQLGRQTIPESIVFETLDDFLHFGGYREAYRQFCATAQTIVQVLPALKVWLTQQTTWVLEYQKQWPQLLAVAAFVQQHPQPSCYLRELPIPGIDSKFLEQHKKILSEMFTVLLPESAIDQIGRASCRERVYVLV